MLNFFRRYSAGVLADLPANRLLALDVFRGLTITAMVLVNNPGSWSYVYSPMLHAEWHGWTPTDLIFPFFVFIMGISIAIVMNREMAKGRDKIGLIKNAAVRCAKLFGLGLFLALFYYNTFDSNFSWLRDQLMDVRIMGVLQRLGLVFVLSVVIVLYFGRLGRGLWMAGILFLYWLALMFVPYSDESGRVYQGLLVHGNNLVAWIDHMVLGSSHVYYAQAQPFAFDPEGLLSTLPAVAGCLAGVFTGDLLTDKSKELAEKTRTMLLLGAALAVAGEIWGLAFPINKGIWTSSFVVMSTGWALLLLGALTWLIDMKGVKSWTAPFVVFGANAIAFYMFSGVLARILMMWPVGQTSMQGWLYTSIYQPVFGNYNGSLMFAMSMLIVCYSAMHGLYKRKIFFKV